MKLKESELEEYDGISCGLAIPTTVLFEDPRKFRINVGTLKTSVALEVNKEYYFILKRLLV